jgi:hypothetical protein
LIWIAIVGPGASFDVGVLLLPWMNGSPRGCR